MTPLDSERDPHAVAEHGVPEHAVVEHDVEQVTPTELNAWRRGFTPQAEIWNGRLAMLGLSVGLSVLLVARLASH
jgi:hypothetical protein